MIKSILIATLLMLISVPLSADYSFIGLFGNELHNYYAYCPTSGFYPMEMWIWCLPGESGMRCAEFRIKYPDNSDIIQSTIVGNKDIISVSLGSLDVGISVCYKECQYNWHWIYRQTLYVCGSAPGVLEIAPHLDTGDYQYLNCQVDGEIVHLSRLADLHYNDSCAPFP